MVPRSYNEIVNRGLERIAALSDGVFAIAMTLIVFEIRVPDPGPIRTEAELWNALTTLGPRIVTYLLSFLTLGIFWHSQQTQMAFLARADRHYGWIMLAFLAGVAFMPFTTSLLAEFITYRLALVIYWLNIEVLGAILYGGWAYVERHGFVRDGTPPEVGSLIRRRIIGARALYAFGAVLCLISPLVSIGFIVLVQLNFAIAPRIPVLSRF